MCVILLGDTTNLFENDGTGGGGVKLLIDVELSEVFFEVLELFKLLGYFFF